MFQEYSKRLGKISDGQFQKALQRFDLGNFVHAESISFGLFGQNLFLTSTKGEFVLRGAPHYDWQFPTEKFFVEKLHTGTKTPVPFPYLLEPGADIFGWSFVIMPKKPGLQIADIRVVSNLTLTDRQGIARALAKALIELQTLTWAYPGKYDAARSKVQPLGQNYRLWVIEKIRELSESAQTINNNTPKSDTDWIENMILKASSALEAVYEPCVVLEDYKEANTVVERLGDDWQVSGIFDLMTAHFGDGEADLARQVGAYLRDASVLADEFVLTYLQNKPVQPGFVERQQIYMIYDSLLIWEFWQRHAGGLPENNALTFEQWSGPFVAYWEKFRNIQ